MVMSTQTLRNAGRLLATVLIDELQVLNVGPPVTVGVNVTRELTPVGDPIAGLVQSVTLESAIDGRITQSYTIKVQRGTVLDKGQAVRVTRCAAEPDLVGQTLLIDTISRNGLALIRKGTASIFANVNQEGKP